jgi:hypothetical protein
MLFNDFNMLILKIKKIILIYFLKNTIYYYINIHKKRNREEHGK